MAKKTLHATDSSQQEEMTVVVLKFKGGSQSLQKGFDAVTQAIAALSPAPSNHRVIVQRGPAEITGGEDILDAETEEIDEVETTDAETGQTTTKATRTKRAYTFMDDFDLAPPDVQSLTEYCEGKEPLTENDKFLVASAWIQTHGNADPFTGRHLFTAFRAMNWKPQVDMTQPLRAMKASKSWYDNPSQGKWKLTGIGLKAAEAIVKV
jgi:hypothetical protein